MNGRYDHRSYEAIKAIAILTEKESGCNGIRTHDLRVGAAMLYKLSYETIHVGR